MVGKTNRDKTRTQTDGLTTAEAVRDDSPQDLQPRNPFVVATGFSPIAA
jgi:hypothetical protein